MAQIYTRQWPSMSVSWCYCTTAFGGFKATHIYYLTVLEIRIRKIGLTELKLGVRELCAPKLSEEFSGLA